MCTIRGKRAPRSTVGWGVRETSGKGLKQSEPRLGVGQLSLHSSQLQQRALCDRYVLSFAVFSQATLLLLFQTLHNLYTTTLICVFVNNLYATTLICGLRHEPYVYNLNLWSLLIPLCLQSLHHNLSLQFSLLTSCLQPQYHNLDLQPPPAKWFCSHHRTVVLCINCYALLTVCPYPLHRCLLCKLLSRKSTFNK